ncbi:hypothetical protein GCM10010435_16680 [Winogradskya consettensis]|uniref:Uncharacterized protein n=1 Tax=Winogradskya consettensis TaxID=113560 RepID=A0A919SUM6_9ACTN|nr:hypothetical protein [Actinoplanes consettensis]GIM78817.1 hypothetical protein Aco04nite_62370 [Actinoplanes consettensis]
MRQPLVEQRSQLRALTVDLELILAVCNGEDAIREQLAAATTWLLALGVAAGVAVVDRGSSDRTIEAVDEFAVRTLVPVRILGCSASGWGAAALRGVRTSRARFVVFTETPDLAGRIRELDHAVRVLDGGQHIVCLGPAGRRLTVLQRAVAELLFSDELPDDAGFVPRLRDIPRHAGIRMAAHGSSRATAVDATLVRSR